MSRQAHQNDKLLPTITELSALAALSILYLIGDAALGEYSYAILNVVGPCLFAMVLVFGIWHTVQGNGQHIWTTIVWFRLSTTVYFAVGTLAIYVVNSSTLLFMRAFYNFQDHDVFKLNLVVTISTTLALCVARLVMLAIKPPRLEKKYSLKDILDPNMKLLPVIGAFFLVIGLGVNYGLKVPQDLGLTSGQWSASVLGLARMTLVGIFMVTVWGLKQSRAVLIIISVIAATEILLQLLMFAKTNTMLTLIMYMMALLWHKFTLRRVVVCAAVVIATFSFIKPIVAFGRAQLGVEVGDETRGGFPERWKALNDYFETDLPVDEENAISGVSRISYVNAATFVIRRYDDGMPSAWEDLLPAVFVPRFLWPEKPILSDVGPELYEIRYGRRTSAVGTGIIASAYWARGWTGIAVYMSIYGVLLGIYSRFAERALARGKWLYFPLVLMCMYFGFKSDGHYLTDVAGASVVFAGTYAIFAVLDLVLMRRPPTRTPRRRAAGWEREAAGSNRSA